MHVIPGEEASEMSDQDAGRRSLSIDQMVEIEERRRPGARAAIERAAARRRLLDQLATARRQAGVTQSAVAAAMGTLQPAIARLETGDADPKLSTMLAYADALGVEWRWQLVPR